PVAPKDSMSTLQSTFRRLRRSSPIRGCGPPPAPAGAAPPRPLWGGARRRTPRGGGGGGPSRQESGAGTRRFRSIHRSEGRRSCEGRAARGDVALLQQQRGLHLRQAVPGGGISV